MRATALILALLAGCDGPVTDAGRDVEVWVANLGAREVLRYGPGEREPVAVVTEADLPEEHLARGFAPSGLALHEGRLLVTNFASGDVLAFDPHDGGFLELIHGGGAPVRLEEPCAIQVDGDSLWVLGNDSRNVAVLSDGAEPREVGTTDPIRGGHALDVIDGLLYVATSPSRRDLGLVQVRDPATGELVGHFAPWPELEEATHLLRGPGAELVVTDWFTGTLHRYDRFTREHVGVLVDGALDGPVAAAWGPEGRLWVLDATSVVALDPASGVELLRIDGGGRFDWARNLLVTPTMPP